MELKKDFLYILSECTDPEKQIEKKCEKLTREVSIKFSEWLIRKCDFQEDKTWLYKGMDFSIKDLFEIFEHDVE